MKINIQLLLMVTNISIIFSISPFNYCAIKTCAPDSHTLCKYSTTDIALERCHKIISYGLTLSERNRIINLHNYFRENVYKGNELQGNDGTQPAAADFRFLEWDRELAMAAQTWAQQCPTTIDNCRNVVRFLVNQSLGKKRSRTSIGELTIEEILWSWYDEVRKFNASKVSSYTLQISEYLSTQHYTQMVWGNTTRLGCGQIKYFDGTFNRLALVCNYGARGNIFGEPVYKIRDNSA